MTSLLTPSTALSFDLSLKKYGQLIDGQLVDGADEMPVLDPGTAKRIATTPVASSEQLDMAVQAARRALPGWSALGYDERSKVLHAVAEVLAAHHEELAQLTTLEQGKPISEARDDVAWSIDFTRYFADYRLDTEILRDDASSYVELRRKPVGVVGAITPWNFPLFQAVYKLAPALIVGNTMVLKPSPTTPLATMHFAELVREVIPAGVFNVVGDSGELGPLLTSHEGIDKVSFTGSTVTGRRVMAAAGPSLKRLTLELGGNDAAIVLDDADIDKTADGLCNWAFANAGQVCVSIKRIYAPSSLYEPLVEALAQRVSALTVGHGLDPLSQLGPVQNEAAFQKAREALAVAARDGRVVAGGEVLDQPGYYVQPTLVRDLDENSPLVREETFAPIRSVMPYDDLDEVIDRANDTQYGLGGSVWGSDVERAIEVGARLNVGTSWINHHFQLTPDVPFGGVKQSGLGAEFGRTGIEEFTNVHVVNLKRV
ncbi:aldehyde dehydrogenase family protein [Rhodococcus erythropolis]|jgi:acyl-CoA reductase-like NAD-dependent aldehyde dehydrogenase|uniref:aldehyde dehydrogenase family protein n=1 Tax=Rhodococcus erythropolis TaxID=1833 RepID=UPI000309FF73|nr:aldehyde dehydrogenase family protein [Rhodococcus erythropolis]MBY6382373.1 aldehyde dehydrogenase family protein [Rhodococcus erythropolis]MCW0191516.1 aldehyde dehydrogenase family protein [Rhodococcus sp. (in: high G+C Gram-positive bacteria)]MDN5543651.1 aldehyde dehydrogenase family protein [Rhodococcus sp. (in: high G+C Gram-positive bacteria)]ORI28221.1 aldehyde dehydrogenase [Rhodococcus erythropolis]